MQMNMHEVIVTEIAIMVDYDEICHGNDYGDDNLLHANLRFFANSPLFQKLR